jgi:lysophospholipase L1-like esterase
MKKPSRTLWSALAALTLVALSGSGLTSASAASREPVVLDALGDSYASGYGVPPYSECGRSDSAYAVQVDGRMKIDLDDFAACAGATTATLVSLGQLDALDADTDLVTLSIGGNDIGWSTAVMACLGGSDAQCAGALAATTNKVTTVLPALLDSVYAQVAARAPGAPVLVTGYPRLFSPEYGGFLFASPADQDALNAGADLLNGVLAQAAADHGFQFVDVTKRFVDHGVNAPEPWVLGPFDPGAFHPNTAGYEAYTAAVTAAFVPGRAR